MYLKRYFHGYLLFFTPCRLLKSTLCNNVNLNYYVLKIFRYALIVMNLVATHHNCTSPWDYISHHALHTHIPVHHYTHYTAVTIHSLVLIASPHLHLILTLTFKQHSHMHSLRSLVSPGYISERFSQFVFPCTTWTVDLLS